MEGLQSEYIFGLQSDDTGSLQSNCLPVYIFPLQGIPHSKCMSSPYQAGHWAVDQQPLYWYASGWANDLQHCFEIAIHLMQNILDADQACFHLLWLSLHSFPGLVSPTSGAKFSTLAAKPCSLIQDSQFILGKGIYALPTLHAHWEILWWEESGV